jgi:hypothetical protein
MQVLSKIGRKKRYKNEVFYNQRSTEEEKKKRDSFLFNVNTND